MNERDIRVAAAKCKYLAAKQKCVSGVVFGGNGNSTKKCIMI